jgi:hypothetical protein
MRRDEVKRYWIFRGIKFAVFAAIALAALAFLVMSLWNLVLPAAAGWHALSFVQALGLLVLCRLLFGGLRGRGGWRGHGGWHWRWRMHERWEQMNPAQREQLRAALGSRAGRCGFGARGAAP